MIVCSHECYVGALGDVTETSIVMGASARELDFLVGVNSAGKYAIALGSEGNFRSFECADNRSYGGLIIPNLTFELKFAKAGLIDDAPIGSLVRSGSSLIAICRGDRFGGMNGANIKLQESLPSSGSGDSITFCSWSVVIGTGVSRQTIYSYEGKSNREE